MSLTPEISLGIDAIPFNTILPDPELVKMIENCMANNRAAQEQLYKRYYGKIMSLCMRYVKNRDDALEILNTGFLKVFKNLERYEFNGSFDGWIYRIVYHSIIDRLRVRMRSPETVVLDDSHSITQIDASVMQNLYADDLFKLLDQLPDTTRIVFNMFAIEGYKHEEIGTLMNISEGTSKWHVNHARTLLKSIIEKNRQRS